MIEAGTALIAACLPSLRCLVANKSLQSIMNSARSLQRSLHRRRVESHHRGYAADIRAKGHSDEDEGGGRGQRGHGVAPVIAGRSDSIEAWDDDISLYIEIEKGR